MSRALLDINFLLALLDSDHIYHEQAHQWLDREIDDGWASCAITENGFVRIISQPRYPSPISPSEAMHLLSAATDTPHHVFWPGTVSLLNEDIVERSRIHNPRQVTDAYLLALAVVNDGRFVTFDRSVALAAVHRADDRHLEVL
ncbi:MAG: VapC toxin family PIN domain ribonuclease [Acidimicrobiia bacterium]|nr:VapC toxin family PIN domain ribonuclease [Acidimicrobiia bacterium]